MQGNFAARRAFAARYTHDNPSTRDVDVFTRAEAGAWLSTDQSGANVLMLGGIDLALPSADLFMGLAPYAA